MQRCRPTDGSQTEVKLWTEERYRNMRRVCFSIRIGMRHHVIIHLVPIRGVICSWYNRYGCLYAHCGWKGQRLGRSEKNMDGVWGHYDKHGRLIGYSKQCNILKSVHYDRQGRLVGSTYGRRAILTHVFHKVKTPHPE